MAYYSHGDLDIFFKLLAENMELVKDQLYERMLYQGSKYVYNFPILMGQKLWRGSEHLNKNDKVMEALKEGSLSIGFCGLAECLILLTGQHHGESESSQQLGLDIIGFMRNLCDNYADESGLNYSLLATPAESLSSKLISKDKEDFGIIPGVTDKEYYTNSFHVPVSYNIRVYDKINIEAPYHALCNAGHISYIELDGRISDNIPAFMTIIKMMKESGIGYGAINHPLDRDPECEYNGVIEGHICPYCQRDERDGVAFERIRRITGYLVGTLDRFNNGKAAEERDRAKHGMKKED